MKPALFLDRDGVINRDTNYAHKSADIIWIDGIFAALKRARDAGYWVFVVTNQAGVGRGYYTEDDVKALHDWMQAEFARHGAGVDAFMYCPHHPEHGQGAYKLACECRKPKPGMLLELMKRFPVDTGKSLLIGDSPGDIEAAAAAGVKGYLFTGGNLDDFLSRLL
jgi:D-glycero-D-manno-heptose 1,7-bisphosphate phosphatase